MKMMGLVGALFFVLSLADCLLGVALFNTVLAQIVEGLLVFALEQDNHVQKSSYLRGGSATTAGGADHGSHDRTEDARFLKQNETAMAVGFEDIQETGYLQRHESIKKRSRQKSTVNVEIVWTQYGASERDGLLMCHPTKSVRECRWERVGTSCGWWGRGSCKAPVPIQIIWTMNHEEDQKMVTRHKPFLKKFYDPKVKSMEVPPEIFNELTDKVVAKTGPLEYTTPTLIFQHTEVCKCE
ncbi:unnamed protein product [Amoebophrya sp. A25]|nr:unnamed protein product [Amoebophrya sp. A25]|eukprot:GSA25T00008212001.1